MACVQVVDGNRLIMTPYDLSFRKDKVDAKLCTKTLTKDEIAQFRKVHIAKPDVEHACASHDASLFAPACLCTSLMCNVQVFDMRFATLTCRQCQMTSTFRCTMTTFQFGASLVHFQYISSPDTCSHS